MAQARAPLVAAGTDESRARDRAGARRMRLLYIVIVIIFIMTCNGPGAAPRWFRAGWCRSGLARWCPTLVPEPPAPQFGTTAAHALAFCNGFPYLGRILDPFRYADPATAHPRHKIECGRALGTYTE